jgi:anaerobic selenocysteine-containing dehydrogenase
MSTCSRRHVLKVLAGGAGAGMLGAATPAARAAARAPQPEYSSGGFGLLYDATICTGCKACVSGLFAGE